MSTFLTGTYESAATSSSVTKGPNENLASCSWIYKCDCPPSVPACSLSGFVKLAFYQHDMYVEERMMAFTSQNWSNTVISNISYQPASINDSTPSVTTTSYCHGLTFQHSDAQFSYYTDDEMRWYAQNLEGYWYYQGPDGEFVLWDNSATDFGKDGSNYKADFAITAAIVDDDIPPPPPSPPPPPPPLLESPLPLLESPPPPPEAPIENPDLHAVASESSSLLDLAASSVEKISSSAAEPEATHQLDTGSDVMSKDDKDQDLKATTLFTDEEGRPEFPVNADGKPMLPFGPEGKRVFPLGPDNKPIFPVDQNNQPVFPVSEDGMPVFPTGPNNTAIVPVDSQGKPVFPLGANMQPLHPVDSFGNMMMPVKVTDGSPAYFPNADGQRITPNDGSRKELFDNAQMWNQSLSYYNNYSYGYASYTTYYNQNATYTSTWANSGRKTKVRPEDIDMPVGPPPPPPVLQVPSVSDITSNFDSSYMTNIIKISGNNIFPSIKNNNNQNNVNNNNSSSSDNGNIVSTDNNIIINNNKNSNNSSTSSVVNMPVDLSVKKSSVEPLLTEEKRQASKSLISRQLKQYVKMKNNALLKRANKPVEEVAQQVRVGIGKQACFAASSSESENEHPALGLDLRPKRAVIKPEHRLSPGLSVKSADQPKKLSEERSAAASPERHSWRRAGGSEGSSKRRRRRSVSTSASESNSRRRKRSRIRDVGEDDDGLVYNKRRRRSINNRRRSRKVYEESYRRRQRRHRSTSADSSSSSISSTSSSSRIGSIRSRSSNSSSSSSSGSSSSSHSSNSNSSSSSNNSKSTASSPVTSVSSASSSNATTSNSISSNSSSSNSSSSSGGGSSASHTPAESSVTVHSNGSGHLSKRRRGRSSSATASGSLPTSDDSGREEQKRSSRKIKRNKNAADQ
ncbi:hypothetical protein T02_9906 [Trichinella nativa]|uniref:Uncharacterized protein n=1 Tax=Trichinella nativa TaxID=6335 RepID=A0A0V1LS21_9BILA|nr:hypothetical protein T02_9906 [Trichinella nativa]